MFLSKNAIQKHNQRVYKCDINRFGLISYPDLALCLYSVRQSEIWVRDQVRATLEISAFVLKH